MLLHIKTSAAHSDYWCNAGWQAVRKHARCRRRRWHPQLPLHAGGPQPLHLQRPQHEVQLLVLGRPVRVRQWQAGGGPGRCARSGEQGLHRHRAAAGPGVWRRLADRHVLRQPRQQLQGRRPHAVRHPFGHPIGCAVGDTLGNPQPGAVRDAGWHPLCQTVRGASRHPRCHAV